MVPEIERASLKDIKNFQERKLRGMLAYLQANSPFYKQLFAEHNINISEIQTLEDLRKIPVTTKEHLQQFNDQFICVPKSDIIDYVTTSGTLGNPVTFGLTDSDLDRLAYNEAISLACCGVQKKDIIQLMATMDRRFMAGLAYFLGARKLGAGIIRVGSGIPELQWDSILKFRPTYLITVPSFLLKLIEYAHLNKIDLRKTGVKAAICIGEPIREQDFSLNILAQRIVKDWNIELYSTYASTEMSTAFNECEFHVGGHQHPELIITEILDDDNNPVPDGEVGELTITTLGVASMPLLRFKTGDMVKAYPEGCKCGRNTLRLGPVIGRRMQMVKYKGTTLYPPAMFNILNNFEEIESYVIEIFYNELRTDEIAIKIAVKNASIHLLQSIKDHFRAKIRVTPKIQFASPETIQRLIGSTQNRKTTNLIDHRMQDK